MARPSRPWFRFYVEAVHDRKLRRLKPEYRWLFVACLAAARQSCEPGWLLVGKDDPMGWDDLVDFAGMPLKAVEQGTDALQDAGVIGFDTERKAWFVPAWDHRQYESDDVTARTRKHRGKERSKDVPGNGPAWFQGTAMGGPETDTETDNPTPTPPPSFVVTSEFCRNCGLTGEHRPSCYAHQDQTIDPAQLSHLQAARVATFGAPPTQQENPRHA